MNLLNRKLRNSAGFLSSAASQRTFRALRNGKSQPHLGFSRHCPHVRTLLCVLVDPSLFSYQWDIVFLRSFRWRPKLEGTVMNSGRRFTPGVALTSVLPTMRPSSAHVIAVARTLALPRLPELVAFRVGWRFSGLPRPVCPAALHAALFIVLPSNYRFNSDAPPTGSAPVKRSLAVSGSYFTFNRSTSFFKLVT